MIQSATPTGRSERREATASRLTALARRLTAERGLTGFTIEELCAEVGVSRRTFFNYFPSKEDAVLGIDESDQRQRFIEEFIGRGSRGWPAVVDDLISFAAEQVRDAGFSTSGHADFFRAVEREPRLLTRFVGLSREREHALVELVAAREGVSIDDDRAQAAVQLVGTILRSASERLLDSGPTADFATLLTDSLAAIRAVTALTRGMDTE